MQIPRISDAIFCDISFKNIESCLVGIISDELGDGPDPIEIIVPPILDGPSEIEMKKAFSYFKILTSNFRFSVSTVMLWSELDINCSDETYAFIAIASSGTVSTESAVLEALVALGFLVALTVFAVLAFVALVFLAGFASTTIGSSTCTVSSTVSIEFIPVASWASASTLARSLALYLRFRGFVLSL
jgi:hypothetical protein